MKHSSVALETKNEQVVEQLMRICMQYQKERDEKEREKKIENVFDLTERLRPKLT